MSSPELHLLRHAKARFDQNWRGARSETWEEADADAAAIAAQVAIEFGFASDSPEYLALVEHSLARLYGGDFRCE